MSLPSTLYKPYSIKGQTALITGASAGIGEACAWRFAEAGCRLVLIARRQERLNALKQTLNAEYKVPIHVVPMDVRDIPAIQELPELLPEEFQKIDILVNNAGLALGMAPIQDNNVDDIQTMVQTNITSLLVFCRVFIPGMVKRNRGHVVNMCSIAGHEAYGGGSVYCATKHAVEAITNSSRHDLIGTKVRVTAISPGAVRTEFSMVRMKGDADKEAAVYEGFDPLTAVDIADNVMYAVTRPLNVQIAEVLVLASHQAGKTVARPNLEAKTNRRSGLDPSV